MLTSDLLRVNVVKRDLKPQFIAVDAPRHQERAARLLAFFQDALARNLSRGEIDDVIRDVEGLSTDHKLIKGMAKLLLDRCEFEPRALPGEDAPDAAALRDRMFRLAAVRGPLARHAGPTGRTTAESLMAEVGAELGVTAAQVSAALYADLKEEQILVSARLPEDASALLHRYNVGLVQAVLLHAARMTVTLQRPTPKRLRQLFRYLKFHQLMYRLEIPDRDHVAIEVDGPESLLKQSSRYGLQLATFFPAVLLQDGAWRLEADILWGNKRKLHKTLVVDSTLGLRSHYQDQGTWRSRVEEWFEGRFRELNPSWTLHPGEPIDLGEQRVLIPDFTFRRGGRVAHLDIVGFWRQGYLEKRLTETPKNVLLAVSRRLSGEKKALAARIQDQLIEYAEIIPAKEVLARLEIIALPREAVALAAEPATPLDVGPVEGEQAGLFGGE